MKKRQSDWRGVYNFQIGPNDIEYITYEKKLTISKYDTLQCYSGCYALIAVTTNMGMATAYDNEKLPFRIYLNRRAIKSSTKIPSQKLNIHLNEFIIGNILNDPLYDKKYDCRKSWYYCSLIIIVPPFF